MGRLWANRLDLLFWEGLRWDKEYESLWRAQIIASIKILGRSPIGNEGLNFLYFSFSWPGLWWGHYQELMSV